MRHGFEVLSTFGDRPDDNSLRSTSRGVEAASQFASQTSEMFLRTADSDTRSHSELRDGRTSHPYANNGSWLCARFFTHRWDSRSYQFNETCPRSPCGRYTVFPKQCATDKTPWKLGTPQKHQVPSFENFVRFSGSLPTTTLFFCPHSMCRAA